jgi:broad specificity phosphatase PhoE
MVEMWLIRHGQTDWNLARKYQGQADIPLNQTGIEQAEKLAQTLEKGFFDIVYSSDLIRAQKTAQIIADRLDLEVIIDRRLREIHQGVWEGLSLDEVKEKYAEDFERGARDPETTRAPGGESVAEVAARMALAANEIRENNPEKKILLVSHGLAVSTLYCQANDISLSKVYEYIPDNAVPLVINWNGHK